MTVKLTFEFENIQQATDFCVRCAPHATHRAVTESAVPVIRVGDTVVFESAPPAGQSVPITATADSTPVAAPKRRGRKPKVKVETAAPAEAKSQPIIVTAHSTPVAAPSVAVDAALDDAIAALKAVSEAKGMPVCFDILKRHGAVRTSDVLPRSRARFIQDCQDVIAGKDIAAAA